MSARLLPRKVRHQANVRDFLGNWVWPCTRKNQAEVDRSVCNGRLKQQGCKTRKNARKAWSAHLCLHVPFHAAHMEFQFQPCSAHVNQKRLAPNTHVKFLCQARGTHVDLDRPPPNPYVEFRCQPPGTNVNLNKPCYNTYVEFRRHRRGTHVNFDHVCDHVFRRFIEILFL